MFSGIIEAIGSVQAIETFSGGKRLWIQAPFVQELSLGQSIAHNGTCLTVTAIKHRFYCVEVVKETLERTNLGSLELNSALNLERSVPVGGRWEGHIVQGHIDTTLRLHEIQRVAEESFYFTFELAPLWATLIVEKGSIAINGVSLTVAKVNDDSFCVAIIPWTYRHTTFQALRVGDRVNVEFDLVAKYLWRWASLYETAHLRLSEGLSGEAATDRRGLGLPATEKPPTGAAPT
jgi:riboflavin synthase